MVKLTDVTFSYRKRKPVLSGINLALRSGIIYGLLGKNGEGKTTLLHLISGLVFPDSGLCRVMDYEPARRQSQFLQDIFLLPEEIMLPELNASDYYRMYAPFYPHFSEEILKTCVESFDVDLSSSLCMMSLGQKKKVAIALALAARTPLLLMDEPTNGLDIPSKAVFRKLLSSCMSEEQTVLISTHQVRDLESLIDAVVILNRKEVVFNRTLDEIASTLDFRLLAPEDKALYHEQTPAGTMGVVTNHTGEESLVSLELLFNATTQATTDIKELFTPLTNN
jgi:ABC-2 type transport system ATP-binding protein